MTKIKRCAWVSADPLYIEYHDQEWGKAVYDSQHLFEMLMLEGMQAGLSWITILKRRESYRKAFAHFDAKKIIRFNEAKIEALMQDAGIIRHRLKIEAIIKNAKAYLALEKEGIDFSEFLWGFVGGKPIVNQLKSVQSIPVATVESRAMAKALKKKGFTFVGDTICYAFMQAVGMVNDHTIDCFCYKKNNKR